MNAKLCKRTYETYKKMIETFQKEEGISHDKAVESLIQVAFMHDFENKKEKKEEAPRFDWWLNFLRVAYNNVQQGVE